MGEHGVYLAPPTPGSISQGPALFFAGWDWRTEEVFRDVIIDVVQCTFQESISLRQLRVNESIVEVYVELVPHFGANSRHRVHVPALVTG